MEVLSADNKIITVIRQEQTGEEYEDAIDVINAPYTYIETDKRVQDVVGIEDYTELRG